MVAFSSSPFMVRSNLSFSALMSASCSFFANILYKFCSSSNNGTWYTLFTSCTLNTHPGRSTWQKLAILSLAPASSTSLHLQKITVGDSPTLRRSRTPCCVGFVFCSSHMIGTNDTKVGRSWRVRRAMELPQRLEEHGGFDIAHRPPHLDEADVGDLRVRVHFGDRPSFAIDGLGLPVSIAVIVQGNVRHGLDPLLYLVRYVGHDLDCLAEIIPPPLLPDHLPVYLCGGGGGGGGAASLRGGGGGHTTTTA